LGRARVGSLLYNVMPLCKLTSSSNSSVQSRPRSTCNCNCNKDKLAMAKHCKPSSSRRRLTRFNARLHGCRWASVTDVCLQVGLRCIRHELVYMSLYACTGLQYITGTVVRARSARSRPSSTARRFVASFHMPGLAVEPALCPLFTTVAVPFVTEYRPLSSLCTLSGILQKKYPFITLSLRLVSLVITVWVSFGLSND
jgi:hypothetical protein